MPKQDPPTRDLLEGHTRYKKLKDLNEGTFGVVMLALDLATNERVCSNAFITAQWLLRGRPRVLSSNLWACPSLA